MRLPFLTSLLLVTLMPLGAASAKDKPQPLQWKLHPSELIHYEQRQRTMKDGKESVSGWSRKTVFGHDIRADGQYAPVTPYRADLPMMLGLWVPIAKQGETKWKVDLVFPKTIATRFKGKTRVDRVEGSLQHLVGEWTFARRGTGERGDTHELRKGTASVAAVYDEAAGHITEARVVLQYRRMKLKGSSADKPEQFDRVFEIRLKKRYAFRYDGFQKAVDAAIDKGVAYLKTLQVKEGEEHAHTFKPHGAHRIGSTALAVFTLAACGVPREDPAIQHALEWLLTQDPQRTYDRALCVMAFDKVFTPKDEHERLSRGKQKHPKRDLSKAQMDWCRNVADDLIRSASSPGSWGYPTTNRRALLKFDTSNSQYAVLGMRAAMNLGVPVDEGKWLGVIRHFRLVRERDPEPGAVRLVRKGDAVHDDGRYADTHPPEKVKAAGGFAYGTLDGHKHPWSSMTCAGIACLAIARNALQRMKSPKLNPGLKREVHEMMLGGWAWLEAHWGMDRHPEKPGNNWYFYYLYSLERAAVLGGVRRVGLKDWYFEGAMQLILRQGSKGNWDYGGGSDIAETCFGLLFLKRATSPLVTTGD